MNLSEAFYEAACDASHHNNGYGSCFSVDDQTHHRNRSTWSPQAIKYQMLMGNEHGYLHGPTVEEAAYDIKWEPRDFRTFMLLMASEAVK